MYLRLFGNNALGLGNELGYSQDWQCALCRAILIFICIHVILSLFPYLICPITFPLFKHCIKSLDLLEVWSHEDQWLLDQHVLAGHSIQIPLELTPALIVCCDAVTTCDYSIFWMALQCSLHCIPLKIDAVISKTKYDIWQYTMFQNPTISTYLKLWHLQNIVITTYVIMQLKQSNVLKHLIFTKSNTWETGFNQ